MIYIWKLFKKGTTILSANQEKLIGDALKINNMSELNYLKSREEMYGPHTFSPEFEKRMELLFDKSKTEYERVKEKNTLSLLRTHRAAFAAVCAIMMAVIFVGIKTEAIPFPKFTYTLRKDEGSYAYLVEQEKYVKDVVEETYEVTYIPKDFNLEKTYKSAAIYYMNFRTENNQKCIFQQSTKKIITRMDDILKYYKEMVFDESKFYVMDKNSFIKIIWYANGYQYYIQANLPVKELVKIAQSLEVQ